MPSFQSNLSVGIIKYSGTPPSIEVESLIVSGGIPY